MTCDEVELRLLALPADASVLVVEPPTSQIDRDIATLLANHRIIQFKGRLMIEVSEPYLHFVPLTKEHYDHIVYPLLSPVKKSYINELFWHLSHKTCDLSGNDHLVVFGSLKSPRVHLSVWDMETLELRDDVLPADCVRRSPYPLKNYSNEPLPLIMWLADNKQDLYDDIMQSIAPLVMIKKPDGVIWWVGGDNDAKATLIEALRRIFPDQLAGLTIQRLNGRRGTLELNGKLGNITEDSGQVHSTEIYRSIGTHEDFFMHRYHSQDGIYAQGNVHHIFSTSSAPTFNTIDEGILRRTQVVPFAQSQGYSAHAPTAEFCSRLIAEMCRYAMRIKRQGYSYEWSGATLATKAKSYPSGNKSDDNIPLQPRTAQLNFCW